MTPLRPTEGAADTDRCTKDRTEEGVEVGYETNADVEATFPRSSHVTSTSSIETTFFMNEELVSTNIENILGNYTLFNLVFII